MKNSFMNLALPLWLFSEPLPPIENKDKEYDPIMMSASFAIPKSILYYDYIDFTNWDKINVSGPMTLGGVIEHL